MLTRAINIAELIPHGAAMCLLDKVVSWDAQHIVCESQSHLREDNPLREGGQLAAIALVEYAAQAAAVHAALTQNTVSAAGEVKPAYLGAIKELNLFVRYIASDVDILLVGAQCVLTSANGAIYAIEVKTKEEYLIQGKIILVQS